MPRTFSTKNRKVKQQGKVCEYCGYGMYWQRGFLLPSGWHCPNETCVAQELEDEAARNFWGDEPDWTQG